MNLNNSHLYPVICFKILDIQKKQLGSHLSYHGLNHTIDVSNICNNYIKRYSVGDKMAKLLRIAAVSHDLGYAESPINHEERSIELIQPILQPVLSEFDISIINGMIRATKVPQKPLTFYEKILADADLDYLGRKDYDTLSELLRQEFEYFGLIKSKQQWLSLQIDFLQKHTYHTLFAKMTRRNPKNSKLRELKIKLSEMKR